MFLPTIHKKGVKEDGTTLLNMARNVVFIQSNPATNYKSISH